MSLLAFCYLMISLIVSNQTIDFHLLSLGKKDLNSSTQKAVSCVIHINYLPPESP